MPGIGKKPEFISHKNNSLIHNGVEYLTLGAAAHRAEVSSSTISSWIGNGYISVIPLKGRKLVRADAIEAAKDKAERALVNPKPTTEEERNLIYSDRPAREVAFLTGRTANTIHSLRIQRRRAQENGGQA